MMQMEVESSTNATLMGAAIDELVRENKLLEGKVHSLESELRHAQSTIKELKGTATTLTQRICSPNNATRFQALTAVWSSTSDLCRLLCFRQLWPSCCQCGNQNCQLGLAWRAVFDGADAASFWTANKFSCRFAVPLCTVSKLIHAWIDVMARNCGKLVIWLTRKAITRSLPQHFKASTFEKLRGILDSSEVFIQKPVFLEAYSQTYSHYKCHNTFKLLVPIQPSVSIRHTRICLTRRCASCRQGLQEKATIRIKSNQTFIRPK